MTNEIIRELDEREDIPIITPYEAGRNLGKITLEHDFTLYEFFLTDVYGHKQDWEKSVTLIQQIDEFIGGLMSILSQRQEDVAWLLTSDHGNIEDFSVKGHTHNPVPALGWSNRPVEWPQWKGLEDVTPGIVRMLLQRN